MAKYVLKCDILGGGDKVLKKGSLIELTDEQAEHPLYSNRIDPTRVVEDEPEAKVVAPPKKG